jgi:hypothetical protein
MPAHPISGLYTPVIWFLIELSRYISRIVILAGYLGFCRVESRYMSPWDVKLRHLIRSNRRFGKSVSGPFSATISQACVEFQRTKTYCLEFTVSRNGNDKQNNMKHSMLSTCFDHFCCHPQGGELQGCIYRDIIAVCEQIHRCKNFEF